MSEDAKNFNQSTPFVDVNLFETDLALRGAVVATVGIDSCAMLSEFGATWGSAESFELGRLANEHEPQLRSIEPRGARIDAVEFHPAYHELMRRSFAAGLHASTWEGVPHVVRAAQVYMAYQCESGHVCPVTMTHAARAALRASPSLLEAWSPLLSSRVYDPSRRPWREKSSVSLGMAMTEIQGGTDLKANETRATPRGDVYEIDGAKWFMSAPMSDGFLVLAQAPGGLACFLISRLQPDGALNGLRLQRLKAKLGNRSNASSEIVFESARAERVGEEGQGISTLLAMAQMTRLDCAVASAGLMRFGLAQAAHHARERRVFGRALVDLQAMRATLADLALEVEASTALAIRLAHAHDRASHDGRESFYARLLTPAAKFLLCKTAPSLLYECMECLGGNGYVEDWPLARAYREAPVNAIWEGSGSVMALDMLRAARGDPQAALDLVASLDPPPDWNLAEELVRNPSETSARRTAERLARAASRAALAQFAPELAGAYEMARCRANGSRVWGGADLGGAERLLIDRILP